jgi:parvulin-like peptidyl-prolyl isomerase
MTKRQLSHWQKESRLQRLVMISGVVLIVAVLAVMGTGVYLNKFRPYQATAIKVDGKSYDVDYYIDTLALMGTVNGSSQYIPYLTTAAVQTIEQDYFFVREAAKSPYNISVSDDEVKAEVKTEGLPTNQATSDAVRGRLLIKKLQDYFDKNVVPANADSKNLQAMFLESQSQADEIKARIDKGEKFSDIAAQLSLESTSKGKNGNYDWVPQGVLPSLIESSTGTADTALEDKVFSKDTPANTLTQVEDKDLSKSVGYWLVKVTDAPAASATPAPSPTPSATPNAEAHVLLMLLSSQQQASEIKARLDAGGSGNDFSSLAKQYSSYSDAATNGGDLGMKKKGDLPSAVDKAIFPDDASKALQKNAISAPIQDTTQTTTGGVWLFTASETQSKPVTGDYRTILVNKQVQDWQNKVWNDNKDSAQNLLTEDQTSFAIQQAQARALK